MIFILFFLEKTTFYSQARIDKAVLICGWSILTIALAISSKILDGHCIIAHHMISRSAVLIARYCIDQPKKHGFEWWAHIARDQRLGYI